MTDFARGESRWAWRTWGAIPLCLWVCGAGPVEAIQTAPTRAQIDAAVQRGKVSASQRVPPDRLYAWFGSDDELKPKGFLLSKLVGVTVMASHFALRGEHPTDADLQQILDSPSFLVTATIFGERPDFAVNTYVVMEQGGKTIKPVTVRFDGSAARTTVWPKSPAYRAKIVASFNYADLDPVAPTRLLIYPPAGGEVGFDLDLSHID